MKKAFLWPLLNLAVLNCWSQSFEGKWQGLFTYNHADSRYDNINNYPIKLNIVLNSDSSYSCTSEFKGLDNDDVFTTITCGALVKVISEDSVYIQEIVIYTPKNGSKNELKKMTLKKITRKRILLEGIFEGTHNGNRYTGRINLTKTD